MRPRHSFWHCGRGLALFSYLKHVCIHASARRLVGWSSITHCQIRTRGSSSYIAAGCLSLTIRHSLKHADLWGQNYQHLWNSISICWYQDKTLVYKPNNEANQDTHSLGGQKLCHLAWPPGNRKCSRYRLIHGMSCSIKHCAIPVHAYCFYHCGFQTTIKLYSCCSSLQNHVQPGDMVSLQLIPARCDALYSATCGVLECLHASL